MNINEIHARAERTSHVSSNVEDHFHCADILALCDIAKAGIEVCQNHTIRCNCDFCVAMDEGARRGLFKRINKKGES